MVADTISGKDIDISHEYAGRTERREPGECGSCEDVEGEEE